MIRIPHLETNITISCQNRCIACNHFVPMQLHRFKQSMLDPAVFQTDLRNLSRICHADGFALIGGEPTLHPQLSDMASVAKASGIADKVELWSHGQDWGATQTRLEEILEALRWIDKVVISRYPGKATDREIEDIQALCAANGVAYECKDEGAYPNFTQLLEPKDTDPVATLEKYNACWFKTYSRVIDNGFFYKCCTSPFIPQLLQGLPEGYDGLKIDGQTTEAQLRAFLSEKDPLSSCTICAGRNTPSAKPITWQEIKDPQRWQRMSAGVQDG